MYSLGSMRGILQTIIAIVSVIHVDASQKASLPVTVLANSSYCPLILLPGVGGSVMMAEEEKSGDKKVVWVRATFADSTIRSYIWSTFNESASTAETIAKGWHVDVLDTNYGMDGIDNLAPGLVIEIEKTYYYHEWISLFKKIGYRVGVNMFGFPWDWRQSSHNKVILKKLRNLIHQVSSLNNRKVCIVSHSMGGLITRSLIGEYPNEMEGLIDRWITIGTPWQGATGRTMNGFIQGENFDYIFLSKKTTRQLYTTCPSAYELLPSPFFRWESAPRFSFKSHGVWETYSTAYKDSDPFYLPVLEKALKDNKELIDDTVYHFPFNEKIFNYTNTARQMQTRLHNKESSIMFFNIYGVGLSTPFDVTYEKDINDPKELLDQEPVYSHKDGDGTVPVESAKNDGLDAVERIEIRGVEHAVMHKSFHVFQHVKRFLGLSCPWEGVWQTTHGTLRITQTVDKLQGSHEPTPADRLKPKMINFTGTIDATNTVKGYFTLEGTTYKHEIHQSVDCLSFKGKQENNIPTTEGNVLFDGDRLASSECQQDESDECFFHGGKGVRYCIYGRWSSQCHLVYCKPGSYPNKRLLESATECLKCPKDLRSAPHHVRSECQGQESSSLYDTWIHLLFDRICWMIYRRVAKVTATQSFLLGIIFAAVLFANSASISHVIVKIFSFRLPSWSLTWFRFMRFLGLSRKEEDPLSKHV
eukprot:TRINITY_DN1409_c0_g1_i8.p1 TRINITY_DN1409_c0_g1~~TRINITY_DN1409_c0_g1_i8.p1  ORF type:complete len:700 (-),score=90.74 TRINITY_DN1409_c0_g1_i8:499-2598(-)